MISGEFSSLLLTDIQVVRHDRIRRETTPDSVSVLADSISRLGLIHPPVVTRDNVLVSGETRLEAVRSLGWTHIPVQFVDTLSSEELLAIELEENVKRKDLSWQEQCDAVKRFHELKSSTAPDWSVDQTASEIGLSTNTIRNYLTVAKEVAAGNTKVAAAKDYSVALGVARRTSERRAADELSAIGVATESSRPTSPILNTSFLEWVESYSGPPFNLLHCDFPYGISADKFNQGAANAYGGYEDSPEVYWQLVHCLCANRDKLLGTSGHALFWFSMRYYQETLDTLSKSFSVDLHPLIWFKSDNTGALPDPTRGPRRVYETAFLLSHGDRKIISAVANTFPAPVSRVAGHMSEKNEDMLAHFFRMFVDSNTRMLDPTCGSGSALRAARRLGAGSVLGLEINPEFAESARIAWEKTSA